MTTIYPAAEAQNLAELWDKAVRDRDIIFLHRDGDGEDLALLAALHQAQEKPEA